MNKCKNCNCGCHCSVKEHGDMYGLCSCLTCEHEMKSVNHANRQNKML